MTKQASILKFLAAHAANFTYFNDNSLFRTRSQGQRILNALEAKGLVAKRGEGMHPIFEITDTGRELLAA